MIQARTRSFIECDLESERSLTWDSSVLIHTLEAGSPSSTTGHWWKIIGGAFVEIPTENLLGTVNIGRSAQTAASSAINTTETIIVKSDALAANRLAVGTVIRFTAIGTCTSSAANASTFSIRIGTAGTTSDGLMQQAVSSVAATSGTAIPFRMVFELVIRTIGTSATSHGFCTLFNTGTTGISAQTTQIILPTFTNFNTQTANNIVSLTYKSAATTTTCTFQISFIEIVYK